MGFDISECCGIILFLHFLLLLGIEPISTPDSQKEDSLLDNSFIDFKLAPTRFKALI